MHPRKDIFRARPYRHFDTPLSREGARSLATNAEQVARHSFFPFLHRTIETPRYLKRQKKVESKKREIAYAAHTDSVIYSYYGELVGTAYEACLHENGLSAIPVAYRKLGNGECNVHFAQRAFGFIAEHRPCVALGFDVKGFFDHIDHALLRQAWQQVLGLSRLPEDHYRIFRSLTQWSYVDENYIKEEFGIDLRRKGEPGKRICSLIDFKTRVRKAKKIHTNQDGFGIPQGSPMSAVLSNIYMLPFDSALHVFAASCGGFVQRYCDDILLVVPPSSEQAAYQYVMDCAAERKLTINTEPHKLDKVVFPSSGQSLRPIQYLGLTFDGERTMLRSQTLSRYHRKLRFYLKRARHQAFRNPTSGKIYEKTLWERYSHKGDRNFISYARKAVRITASEGIRKQVSRHADRLNKWVETL